MDGESELPSDRDPAKLLPRTVVFEPENADAVKLPQRYNNLERFDEPRAAAPENSDD